MCMRLPEAYLWVERGHRCLCAECKCSVHCRGIFACLSSTRRGSPPISLSDMMSEGYVLSDKACNQVCIAQ